MCIKSQVLWPLNQWVSDRLISFAIRRREHLFYHKGFTIADLAEKDHPDFIEFMKQGIDLVEISDRRRFNRLRDVADFLCVALPEAPLAFSLPRSKIIVINLPKIRESAASQGEIVEAVSRFLVRLSVNGILSLKRIRPTESNCERITQLCERETRRFQRNLLEYKDWESKRSGQVGGDYFPMFAGG